MHYIATISFLIVIVTKTVSQICNENEPNVELNNRTYLGKIYEDGEYFVDNVSGIKKGLVCLKEFCVKKCCPFGSHFDSNVDKCVDMKDLFNMKAWEDFVTRQVGFNATEGFNSAKGLNCAVDEQYVCISDEELQFTLDGRLQVVMNNVSQTLTADEYCVEILLSHGDEIQVVILWNRNTNLLTMLSVSASCMLVSCFFMILTFTVYVFLPELRCSVPGMIMIAWLMSFFVTFFINAVMEILFLRANYSLQLCTIITIIGNFTANVGFFWLNVMCYDVWKKFRKLKVSTRGASSDVKTKILRYSAYAFGVPTVWTILLATLEFADLGDHELLPNLRRNFCFATATIKLIYFDTPMLLTCLLNVVFIALVITRILQIKKQTQRLQRKDTQRFLVFIKLFILSGFSWIFQVISVFHPEYEYAWLFTDAYNSLVGFIIFIMFVCKRKILAQIAQRYKTKWGNLDARRDPTPEITTNTPTPETSNISLSGQLQIPNENAGEE